MIDLRLYYKMSDTLEVSDIYDHLTNEKKKLP